MANVRHIIWQEDVNFDDWCKSDYEEHLEINGLDRDNYTNEDFENWVKDTNNEYFHDEKANLSTIAIENPIIILGDLGLWNGRHTGYKVIENPKGLSDCLDYNDIGTEYYVDENGDFCSRQPHHDGVNFLTFRELCSDVTEDELELLLDSIYEKKDYEENIAKYTTPLGEKFADLYGWNYEYFDPCRDNDYSDLLSFNDNAERLTCMYYNPDSNAGGQYVVTHVYYDEIRRMAQERIHPDKLLDEIIEFERCELVDKNSKLFYETNKEFQKVSDENVVTITNKCNPKDAVRESRDNALKSVFKHVGIDYKEYVNSFHKREKAEKQER